MTPDEARRLVSDLYERYDITDRTQAHRLIGERFTQDDYDAYRAAITVLFEAGELG